MTEPTTDPARQDLDPIAHATAPTAATPFPQDRGCPYHPPAGYEPLRAGRPLSRVTLFDGRPVWAVTGHALARRLLADPRLSTDRTHPDFPVPAARFANVEQRRVALLGVDDPEHNVQRRMLIPSFSVKRIGALRPRIQETVDRLLDAMERQGPPAELVSAYALPVPSMVICALLGVPYADHEFFEECSQRLLRGPGAADVNRARDELEEYLGALIDRKRTEPGEGLLDELIHRDHPDGPVGREELISFAVILLIAGHETTANMISLGTFTLLRHPEQLAALRAGETTTTVVVEELLRFLSIAEGLQRLATEDMEVDGTTIRKGEGVVFSTSLINRDADVFPRAETLDWDRPARHHLAFGFGVHQCLGQNLARAELDIAMRTLFERLPNLRLAVPAQEIPHKPGDTIQGMLELPVAW
ncbi:cytochrome P450 [Streptomyces microflavus]|uniref:Cytochrome P450 n=1 Tax=Streptomyces microflavus TaxID=1919 RepID=A0A6N9V5W9_STRMI|nr:MULTISPECIES: cytochrome P450 [Streptomyces]MBW3356731.1 cytochrome P450 [Streptomyces sp. 09ZI22]MEE1732810.1 cytochrome P450 [Streptomyces sp. BE282]NEB65491.1 cytochrome P450 [Streptomyces microflavus]OXY99864.1 cytochrome [Streptomyces sp. 2R]QKW41158.1 cytochrome P450 [Streptomyces microflavus]